MSFHCIFSTHLDERFVIKDLNKFIAELTHSQRVNTLSDKFVKIFNDTLDKHAPYRYASRKEQRSFNKPWLTKGILTSIAKKNSLYRKQLTTNNPNITRQYKTYRNKLTHLKEISKQNYYKQAFQKCHHDTKKTWKLVNEIIAIKNKSQQNNKLFWRLRMPKTMWRFKQFFLWGGKIPIYKNKTIPYHLQTSHQTYKFKKFIIPNSYWCIWNPTSHQKP